MGFTSVTLVKEDGTGSNASANTYASAADADTYFSKRALSNVWFGDTDINRTMALQWATRLIDVGFEFYGRRALETQPLAWPRQEVPDRDGALGGYLATNLVPREVVMAVCEEALQILTYGLTAPWVGVGVREIQSPAETPGSSPERIVYDARTRLPLVPGEVRVWLRNLGRYVGLDGGTAVTLERV